MARAKPKSSAIEGRELELIDGLLPGLYSLATGKPLRDASGQPIESQKMDPAMVDRVIKVLELRLKYTTAAQEPRHKGPSWGAVAPLTGKENGS